MLLRTLKILRILQIHCQDKRSCPRVQIRAGRIRLITKMMTHHYLNPTQLNCLTPDHPFGFESMESRGILDTIGILAKVAQDVLWRAKYGSSDAIYSYEEFLSHVKVMGLVAHVGCRCRQFWGNNVVLANMSATCRRIHYVGTSNR
jgi:hypothetical protein